MSNKQSESVIIWWSKDSSSDTASFAAAELQKYAKEMTGAAIPAIQGRLSGEATEQLEYLSSALIVVTGDEASDYAESNGIVDIPVEWLVDSNTKLAVVEEDSFVIDTDTNHLVLAGMNDRGTLYSAYDLLESVGVKFFAPTFQYYEGNAEYVPAATTLTVTSMDKVVEPSFTIRRKYIEEGWSHTSDNIIQLIDWMAKSKLNTLVVPYDYQANGKTKWDDWRQQLIAELDKRDMVVEVGGHGFESFLTPEKYGAAHPTWFVSGYNVFNLTDDEAVDAYVEEVIAYLKARPEIGIFDCWPPDVATWPPSVIAKFGTTANAYAYVVNKLHEAVQIELPNVRIEAIAYASHVQPPSSQYKYDDSIIIDYAPYFRSYKDTIFNPASSANQTAINQLNSWKNTFDGNISMYEYYRRYAFHSLPIVFPKLIGEELPFYKSFGMNGIGMYSEPGDWITFEITHYMLAKLSWNSALNAEELIEPYIQSRYGAASAEMTEYFDLVEEAGRALYNSVGGDTNNNTAVTKMRDNYLQARTVLTSAQSKVSQNRSMAFMVERLLWNMDFAIADTETNYYRLNGDNASLAQAKLRAQDSMNAHRFDGIILQSPYLVNKYVSGAGNSNWMYDANRGELKPAPMLTTMGTYQNNPISNIVDDNEATIYWSSANPLIGDYVGVDLQSVQQIKAINLLMSTAAKPNDYIRNGVIEVSKDFKDWVTVATVSNQPDTRLTVEEDTEARFIRIRSTAAQTQWVIIREFVVEAEEIKEPVGELQTVLEADKNELAAGETVKLTVALKDIPKSFYALDLNISYDSTLLEFVSAASIKDGLAVVASEGSAGKLRVLAASEGLAHALTGDVQLIDLSFKAKEISDSAATVINLSKAVLGDELGEELTAAPSSITIQVLEVTTVVEGDINGDGKVSVGDLAIVAAQYGQDSSSPDWEQIKAADVNKDGRIDLEDLAAVAKQMVE
ncbi:MAG: DUF4838 domain-containing protein [Candidatus Pristimantibacillus sp.]